jgi:hypothetical protein
VSPPRHCTPSSSGCAQPPEQSTEVASALAAWPCPRVATRTDAEADERSWE